MQDNAKNHCIQNLSKYLNIGHWKSFISKSAIQSCQMATKLYFLSLPFSQHEFYVRIHENPNVDPKLSMLKSIFPFFKNIVNYQTDLSCS